MNDHDRDCPCGRCGAQKAVLPEGVALEYAGEEEGIETVNRPEQLEDLRDFSVTGCSPDEIDDEDDEGVPVDDTVEEPPQTEPMPDIDDDLVLWTYDYTDDGLPCCHIEWDGEQWGRPIFDDPPEALPDPNATFEELMSEEEAAQYLDARFPAWRTLSTLPPFVSAFGEVSYVREDLDKWIASFGPFGDATELEY